MPSERSCSAGVIWSASAPVRVELVLLKEPASAIARWPLSLEDMGIIKRGIVLESYRVQSAAATYHPMSATQTWVRLVSPCAVRSSPISLMSVLILILNITIGTARLIDTRYKQVPNSPSSGEFTDTPAQTPSAFSHLVRVPSPI